MSGYGKTSDTCFDGSLPELGRIINQKRSNFTVLTFSVSDLAGTPCFEDKSNCKIRTSFIQFVLFFDRQAFKKPLKRTTYSFVS